MTKPTATLTNWYLNCNGFRGLRLHGEVFGHTKHSDGTPVITGRVIRLDLEKKTAETTNTIYTLAEE